MEHKLTLEQISDLRNNAGVKLTDEWVFQNYLGWSADQIKEYRKMQLNDAVQRYNIAQAEANGLPYNEKSEIMMTEDSLESLLLRLQKHIPIENAKNDTK